MRMREYVGRRLLLLIPVVIGVTIVVFTVTNILMDPVRSYIDVDTNPAAVPIIRHRLGFDRPIYIRYFAYLYDLVRGEWGVSIAARGMPVLQAIALFLPATLELAIAAMLLVLLVGVPLGVVSALRHNRPADHVSRIVAILGISTPVFWVALMSQFVFYYSLQSAGLPYLPAARRYDSLLEVQYPIVKVTNFLLLDTLITGNWMMFSDVLTHLVLPACVLSLSGIGMIAKMVRSSMLEVMKQDYITLARAKGLKERTVIYKHALRNALIPSLTLSGLLFASLATGVVLIEQIFAWPGIGLWGWNAIHLEDTVSINGFAVFTALTMVFINLAVDLLYGIVDPRIRRD